MYQKAYENLANAIILSAIKDYKSTLTKYRKSPCRYTYNQLKNYEDFFLSDYCKSLTNLDMEIIIQKIRRSSYGK